MNQIFAQGNYLENMEGGSFGDAFPGILEGLQNVNNAFGNGGGASGMNFKQIIELIITSILNPIVALLIGAAVVWFMWGLITYVRRGGEEGDRTKGIQMMSYGILALFVMVSVWGLVYILINTFSLGNPTPPVPMLQ